MKSARFYLALYSFFGHILPVDIFTGIQQMLVENNVQIMNTEQWFRRSSHRIVVPSSTLSYTRTQSATSKFHDIQLCYENCRILYIWLASRWVTAIAEFLGILRDFSITSLKYLMMWKIWYITIMTSLIGNNAFWWWICAEVWKMAPKNHQLSCVPHILFSCIIEVRAFI